MIHFEKKYLIERGVSAHVSQVAVRFQDVDAAGIVFFARIFEYVHAAYEEFLAVAGHPLVRVLDEKIWAAPLRHAEADYLGPLRFGDVVSVALVAAAVEETEISLGFRLVKGERPEDLVAVVQTVHTFVNVKDFRRRPIPDGIAQSLQGVID